VTQTRKTWRQRLLAVSTPILAVLVLILLLITIIHGSKQQQLSNKLKKLEEIHIARKLYNVKTLQIKSEGVPGVKVNGHVTITYNATKEANDVSICFKAKTKTKDFGPLIYLKNPGKKRWMP
jgi:predicted PurR-regulated permease PerM